MKNCILLLINVILLSQQLKSQDLYFGQSLRPQLIKISKQSTQIDTLINAPSDFYVGASIVCDTLNEHLYISGGLDYLGRLDYDMTNFVSLIDGIFSNTLDDYDIKDIKIDAADGFIFLLTEKSLQFQDLYRISRCNLDGSNVTTLYDTPSADHEIHAFTIDPVLNQIYFNESDFDYEGEDFPDDPVIKRMGYSGGASVYSCSFAEFVSSMVFNNQDGKLYYSSEGSVALDRVDSPFGCNIGSVNFQNATGATRIDHIEIDLTNNKYVWHNGSKIFSTNLDGTNTTLLSDSCGVSDLCIDPINNEVYWTSRFDDEIGKVGLNGLNYQKLFADELNDITKVRVDLENSKIYTIQSNDGIYQADLDGSNAVKILDNGLAGSQIDINVNNDYIYYQEFQFPFTKIKKVKTDGSNDEVIVDLGTTERVNSLAVDPVQCHLYYAEGIDNNIYRLGLDGCGKQLILDNDETIFEIDIHSELEKIYWWDDSLCRADLDGTNKECSFTVATLVPGPFTLTSEHIYWYDSSQDSIFKSDLDFSNVESYVHVEDFITGSLHCGDSLATISCALPIDTFLVHKITIDSTITNANKIIADSCITTSLSVEFQAHECVDLVEGFNVAQGTSLEIQIGCN